MKKAVFLDRDGTIIRDMVYLNDPAKIEIFPESYEAIRLLNEHGYIIIVATNQSGVARGIVKESVLKEINQIIADKLKEQNAIITDTYYAPDAVDSGSFNRKPEPGMLLEAAKKYEIDLKNSWMVGDRMTDVEAGLRAGCKSILLQNETTPAIDEGFGRPEIIAKDLLDAAKIIIKKGKK
ncbi:MAG: HAD family hydrolase [Oligoflexia bacterium]|nr:HAD family hydrolase [Oligoflexia bacterium]